jgi:hypothetical protein
MSYESKIYIINYHEKTDWAELICSVNMSNMGSNNGWRELFKNKIPYYFYDGDSKIETDKYGEPLTYTSNIQNVVDWLEKEIKTNNYRRLPILLNLLKGFKLENWDDIHIIHYGY